MRSFFTAVLLALLVSGAAAQAIRPKIPADAALGKVAAVTVSEIEIDGKTYRLAPGVRIFNQRNLTVTPNMVAPGSQARYVLDAAGQVRNVWLVDAADGTVTAPAERTPGTTN